MANESVELWRPVSKALYKSGQWLVNWAAYSSARTEALKNPTSKQSQAIFEADQARLEQLVDLFEQQTKRRKDYQAEVGDLITAQTKANTDFDKARSALFGKLKEIQGRGDVEVLKQAQENLRTYIAERGRLAEIRSQYNSRWMSAARLAQQTGGPTAGWGSIIGSLLTEGQFLDGPVDPSLPALLASAEVAFGEIEFDKNGNLTKASEDLLGGDTSAKNYLRLRKRSDAATAQQQQHQDALSGLEAQLTDPNLSDDDLRKRIEEQIAAMSATDPSIRIGSLDDAMAAFDKREAQTTLGRMITKLTGQQGIRGSGAGVNTEDYLKVFFEDPETTERSGFIKWALENGFKAENLGWSDGERYVRGRHDWRALKKYHREVWSGLGRHGGAGLGLSRPKWTGERVEVIENIDNFEQARGRPVQEFFEGKWLDIDDSDVQDLLDSGIEISDLADMQLRVRLEGERETREGATHARYGGDAVWISLDNGERVLVRSPDEVNVLIESDKKKWRRPDRGPADESVGAAIPPETEAEAEAETEDEAEAPPDPEVSVLTGEPFADAEYDSEGQLLDPETGKPVEIPPSTEEPKHRPRVQKIIDRIREAAQRTVSRRDVKRPTLSYATDDTEPTSLDTERLEQIRARRAGYLVKSPEEPATTPVDELDVDDPVVSGLSDEADEVLGSRGGQPTDADEVAVSGAQTITALEAQDRRRSFQTKPKPESKSPSDDDDDDLTELSREEAEGKTTTPPPKPAPPVQTSILSEAEIEAEAAEAAGTPQPAQLKKRQLLARLRAKRAAERKVDAKRLQKAADEAEMGT